MKSKENIEKSIQKTTNPQAKKLKPKTSYKRVKICCPDCGSDNFTRNGKASNGEQKYRCKVCSRTFCASRIKAKSKLSGIKCPHCGCEDIRLNGKTQNGVQRYTCKNTECSAVTFQVDYRRKEFMGEIGAFTPPPPPPIDGLS
jgi:transposase-like protein